jgi:hypothetical protein
MLHLCTVPCFNNGAVAVPYQSYKGIFISFQKITGTGTLTEMVN